MPPASPAPCLRDVVNHRGDRETRTKPRSTIDSEIEIESETEKESENDLLVPEPGAATSLAVVGPVVGSGKRGKSRRHSYTLALGEAGEACSAIGMARLDGAREQQQKLRRVGLMLRAMIG